MGALCIAVFLGKPNLVVAEHLSVKQTGIVLVVVLIFLVVLMCFDQLLGWLYKLLVKGLESGTDTTSALISGVLGLTSSGAGLPLWV